MTASSPATSCNEERAWSSISLSLLMRASKTVAKPHRRGIDRCCSRNDANQFHVVKQAQATGDETFDHFLCGLAARVLLTMQAHFVRPAGSSPPKQRTVLVSFG